MWDMKRTKMCGVENGNDTVLREIRKGKNVYNEKENEFTFYKLTNIVYSHKVKNQNCSCLLSISTKTQRIRHRYLGWENPDNAFFQRHSTPDEFHVLPTTKE